MELIFDGPMTPDELPEPLRISILFAKAGQVEGRVPGTVCLELPTAINPNDLAGKRELNLTGVGFSDLQRTRLDPPVSLLNRCVCWGKNPAVGAVGSIVPAPSVGCRELRSRSRLPGPELSVAPWPTARAKHLR